MNVFRNLLGYLMAAALFAVAGAHWLSAWQGWADRFGEPAALLALVLSLGGGFNAFGIVGAYFYAADYLHWEALTAAGYGTIGLLFATKGTIAALWRILTAPDPKI